MNSPAKGSLPEFQFKAPRQPLLWGAVAYSVGIIIGVHAWRPDSWWIGAVAACVLAALYFAYRRSGLAWALALTSFVLAGALDVQIQSGQRRLDTSVQPFAGREKVSVIAHVIRDGKLRRSTSEIRQTLDIECEEIHAADGDRIRTHSRIRLSIYNRMEKADPEYSEDLSLSNHATPTFHYGERLQFSGRLRTPRNFRNPGAFDYEGYLADIEISALASAKAEDVELLPGFSGNRFAAWRSRMHRGVIEKVHQIWPPREAALIDAMVIGEEAFIDRDTRVDFQRSGTYHVLVVSGMNVSILAFVVFWALRRMHITEVFATAATVAFCVGYALLTEVGAPVWRATLMCAVYLCTRLLYRDRAMLNALGAAALSLLIWDPRQLLTASFQMTFLCVLIVAGIGIPILERSSQLHKQALANWDSPAYAATLLPRVAQFRVELQIISGRIASFAGRKWSGRLVRGTVRFALSAWELIFISAVMQMGLALPMAYYFHRATTIGLPANLIVVPLTQLMMPAALAALASGYISPVLAKFPAALTTLAVDGITGSVHGLGGLRLADLRVALPANFMVLFAAATLLLALWCARRRGIMVAAGIAGLLLSSFALAFFPPKPRIHPGVLEMTAIDVGEGDSILLVTPNGRTLIVDAGGPIGPGGSQLDFGEDVVAPYLWARGISRLDAIAITHGHSDHIGGMNALLKNFRPTELWVGVLPPSHALTSVLETARSLGVNVVQHWEGDQFDFGGANVRVLFPPADWPVGSKPQNSDSLVMEVSYKETSVLLEGDAEKREERQVADQHPKGSLLKVGHHGSANSTTPELLASAKPAFAVISVGLGNSFGLPRSQTLASLAAAGTLVYRTDLDGAVTFYLDGKSVTPFPAALH